MKLLTSVQMRELDRAAIEDYGIPGIVLMENASRGVYEIINHEIGKLAGKKSLVVCGKGNNGGDGFAVARHLLNAGVSVVAVLVGKPAEVKGDAATNLAICNKLKIPVYSINDTRRLSMLRKLVLNADFIVDALLGTGVSGPVKPLFLKVMQIVNKCDCPVFAVDVPSGVQADDGRVFNGAVNADHTITFGAPKVGLFAYPGAGYSGHVYIVDIGIPAKLTAQAGGNVSLTTKAYVGGHVKDRPADAHKGDCGRLLIIGGSRGMSGAPYLSGSAALRTGAGLVYTAVPKNLLTVIERKLTEGITLPQEEDSHGRFSFSCAGELLKKARSVDAVVLGPGIGVSDDIFELVSKMLLEAKVPMLIDADALNCVARAPELLNAAGAPVVITPHPGEMARLCGSKTDAVQSARIDTAAGFAEKHNVTVVLKGAGTVIASPDGKIMINPTGNPGMATAGSGDVLSGICGALLAEGLEPFAAASCAAFLHGAAGDCAVEKMTRRSLTASDIVKYIPDALEGVIEDN